VWRKYFPAAILLGTCAASAKAAELYRYQNEDGIKVVDWVIPAAYVGSGYEVLNESGQVVRVVPPAKLILTVSEMPRLRVSPSSP